MARLLIAVALAVALAGLCSGCSSSRPAASSAPFNPWQQYYVPSKTTGATYQPRQDVQVRVVALQQFNDGSAALKRYFDDRKLAPEDMSHADAVETRRLVLDALRVREDPATVAILGFSNFTAPQRMATDDTRLTDFAKGVGADFIVVASEFAGEKDGMGMAPVMSTSSGQASASAWGSGGWANGNAWGSGSSLTWVPVQRKYQQWSAMAMYFRRMTPEERALFEAQYSPRK